MKTRFLAMMSVLFISQMANAFVPAKDARLEYKNMPVRGIMGGKTTSVIVFSDGVVIRKVSQAVLVQRPEQVITQLNAYQMDRIERLIDSARSGATQVVPSSARCFVAPRDTNLYQADNGQVFLRSGHFCVGFRENVRPEAKELVSTLDRLSQLRQENSFAAQD